MKDFGVNLLDIVTLISLIAISISILMLLYRVVKGPTNPDRLLPLIL